MEGEEQKELSSPKGLVRRKRLSSERTGRTRDTDEGRVKHNAMEQERRRDLRRQLGELTELLQMGEGTAQKDVLVCASKEINKLKKVDANRKATIQELKERRTRLHERLKVMRENASNSAWQVELAAASSSFTPRIVSPSVQSIPTCIRSYFPPDCHSACEPQIFSPLVLNYPHHGQYAQHMSTGISVPQIYHGGLEAFLAPPDPYYRPPGCISPYSPGQSGPLPQPPPLLSCHHYPGVFPSSPSSADSNVSSIHYERESNDGDNLVISQGKPDRFASYQYQEQEFPPTVREMRLPKVEKDI
eukprot:m.310226 g.310226  ORF g.310226 m.310226 type:complete len:302 (+) comp50308_c0_seq1:112-1017(+)